MKLNYEYLPTYYCIFYIRNILNYVKHKNIQTHNIQLSSVLFLNYTVVSIIVRGHQQKIFSYEFWFAELKTGYTIYNNVTITNEIQ